MDYENRQVPEGINVSEASPLADFFILAMGVGALVVAVVFVLSLMAEWFVRYIPFSVEYALANSHFVTEAIEQHQQTDQSDKPAPDGDSEHRKQAYLQNLADKLAIAQQLPADMSISVHYVDDNVVNAFATLGGNIIMHRGLIEKLPNENALAMVLAHEIAHIKHRDPIVALGRGITVAIALLTLAGFEESELIQGMIGQVSLMTQLSFSRDQEVAADAAALETLLAYYGHAQDAEVLFQVLQQEETKGMKIPEFLSTHPQTEERISAIRAFQSNHLINKSPVPLPRFFRDEISGSELSSDDAKP